MEGSRHERAVIVIMSYVIGFTAAFIFFASNKNANTNEVLFNLPTDSNQAAVISSQNRQEEAAQSEAVTETTNNQDTTLTYTDGLLEISVGDEAHLLSFNPEITGFDADFDSLSQGYHFGEIAYKASEDNRFVFFCERHDADDDACNGYVYEINSNVIRQITQAGEPVFISPDSAAKAGWAEGGLKIGDSFSANENTPWLLISEDSPLDLE